MTKRKPIADRLLQAVAPAMVPPPPIDLYRCMTVDDLLLLRDAFILDSRNTTDPFTLRFCRGRIAAIDQILDNHGESRLNKHDDEPDR